jgi:DNA-binding transcriptional LysR family regulator
VVLVERVGGGIVLTAAGVGLVEHVRAMGEAAARVSLAATGQAEAIDGPVCVTASEAISAFLLPPVLREIREAHPGISLEIVASNQVSDLQRREADIAVRSGRPTRPELVGRKLQDGFGWLYATPEYVASLGDDVRAAVASGRATIFGFDRSDLMVRGLGALGWPVSAANFPILTANHLVQWSLAKAGLGMCAMMEEVGDPEPSVQRVLPELGPVRVPMWLVTHREVRTSRRIRVVFDRLAEGLSRQCRGTRAG